MNPAESIPDLLLACLRQTPPGNLGAQLAQLSLVQWEELTTLAVEQQVPSLLYHRLKSHGYESIIPKEVWQTLQKKYYGIALRNMRLYQELRKLTTALHTQGIPMLVLKGAHLAAGVYESIALRTIVDIDIMVHRADLPTVIQQLQALGYQPLMPLLTLDVYVDHKHHLPPFVHPNAAASIEIHWTITSSTRTYAVPMEDLWARSQLVTLSDSSVRTFCPEDLLLHICMHATYQHQLRQGIRFLCDIDEVVRRYRNELDWESIIQQAVEWKWQGGVFLALYATQKLLDTPIPEHVLRSLRPTRRALPDLPKLQAMLFFADRALVNASSPNFLNVMTTAQLSRKFRLIQQRLILPRQSLAVAYHISPRSPWLYLYYPVRLVDLLRRYLHKTLRMWRGDTEIVTIASQQEKIEQWLEQE